MKNKIINVISVLLCAMFVLLMSVWCFTGKTPDYSDSERRVLADFPEVNFENISSGKFATDFEKYATERFPMRDTYRSIKAYTRLYAFMQKDNNGIYTAQGHLSKLIYPMETAQLDYAAELFTNIKDTHLEDNKIYFSIIPDKNMYLAKDNGFLSMDYDVFSEYMQEKLSFAQYIMIDDLLSADDYYYTDTHWRQNKITDVAERLTQEMGKTLSDEYTENVVDSPFNGVYVGQSALYVEPDTITYLANDAIDNLEVSGIEGLYNGANTVYDVSKIGSKDPYEFFLSGNQAVVNVKNPSNPDGSKLIIFRDSFGSSITPLLAEAYSEITLVDLRYISSSMLSDYVDFEDADVLFLYSTMLLNSSLSMK